MDKNEAREIIRSELKLLREKPYPELVEMIQEEPIVKEHTAPSGATYQIEIEAFWDDKPDGNVRVAGSIDDGGWRAYIPLTDSFIKSPSNEFVGE